MSKKILFFGDSITDASRAKEVEIGEHGSLGFGYVMQIAGQIMPNNPTKYTVINRGISGNRVVDLYARIKSDVWNLEPDLLTVLVGVNDVWHEITKSNGVEIDRFENIYDLMLKETINKLPKTAIVLMAPYVLKGSQTEEQWDRFLEVYEYAKVVEGLAKKYGLHFIPLQPKFDLKAKEFGATNYLVDGVHPGVVGAGLIANEWLEYVNKNNLI